jgi:branched-chain amino acid transport system substrate-binding protein
MKGKKTSKYFFLMAIGVCLVSIFLGLEGRAVQAEDVIKIGQSTALTGPAATWGVGARRSATIAIEEINAKGGVRGKKLQLVVLDSEHKSVKAIANNRKLVEKEKCVALLGGTNSASMLAVAPIINNELKAPLICPATDATKITENEAWEKGLPNYMFRYGMYGRGQSRVMVRFAVEKFGYKRIALFTWTAGWGVTGRGEILKRLEEIGMKPVADETYDTADTDVTPQLMKIRAAKADIILNYGLPRENTYVVRTKDKIGDKTPYMSAWGIASQSYWEAAKDFAEGVMTTTTITAHGPQPEKVKRFLAKYYKRHGKNLEAMPATFAAYDIVNLFAQVMEKVGTDPEAIRTGLENVPYYNGLVKEFKRPVFTKDRHNAFIWDQDFILCRWTSGKLLKVFFDQKGPYVMLSPKEKRYINKKTAMLK